jgi:hypothetical protein
MASALDLSSRARDAFLRLSTDFRKVFGDRFVALLAYTQRHGVAFVSSVQGADLDALAALTETWRRDGLATPLVVTPDEFRRSLDAFPLEYQAILNRHVVIDGRTPLEGARVLEADLRRACEVQAKAHVLHLRQGRIEAAGHTGRLAVLVERSAAPFYTLLAHIARLSGAPADNAEDLAAFAKATVGVSSDLVLKVLALDVSPAHAAEVASRVNEYADAAERLWAFIDTWQPQ